MFDFIIMHVPGAVAVLDEAVRVRN